MAEIQVEPVLKTSPFGQPLLGLITLKVEVPMFVWTELLTHKRFARNASSNRAMPVDKNVEMGFYEPHTFYAQGIGMSSGEELPENIQEIARATYMSAWNYASKLAVSLREIGVSKEQASRILPSIKMIKGLVTGNLRAWKAFLLLRKNPEADIAMQIFAGKVYDIVNDNEGWVVSDSHFPFHSHWDDFETDFDREKILGARIARVSYQKNVSKTWQDDVLLGERLIKSGHLSPFEHIAYFKSNPKQSALYNDKDRLFSEAGWENVRSRMES